MCAQAVLPVLVALLKDEDAEVQVNTVGVIMNSAIITEGTLPLPYRGTSRRFYFQTASEGTQAAQFPSSCTETSGKFVVMSLRRFIVWLTVWLILSTFFSQLNISSLLANCILGDVVELLSR